MQTTKISNENITNVADSVAENVLKTVASAI